MSGYMRSFYLQIRVANWPYFWNVSPNLQSLLIFLYAKQIFRSLSVAYSEVHLCNLSVLQDFRYRYPNKGTSGDQVPENLDLNRINVSVFICHMAKCRPKIILMIHFWYVLISNQMFSWCFLWQVRSLNSFY
jgi:hypothetical protein